MPATRRVKDSTLLLCVTLVTACVTPGKSDYAYNPPISGPPPSNELVINSQFDKVWDRLVARLAQSFFVINNIEKESRLINVSFSPNQPEHFADCGESRRSFQFRDESRDYRYNVASPSTFKIADRWGANYPLVTEATRTPILDGRANIYVAPQQENTIVTVNATYTLRISITGTTQTYNAFAELIGQRRIPPETTSGLSFSTSEPGSAPWGVNGQQVTCRSLGAFEQQVLDLAR